MKFLAIGLAVLIASAAPSYAIGAPDHEMVYRNKDSKKPEPERPDRPSRPDTNKPHTIGNWYNG